MNNVFVTGASGFVGKRLLFALSDKNVFLRLLSRKKKADFETVVCDLQSEKIPDDALDGIDTIFHLAGFAHDMRDAPVVKQLYQSINVDATVRLAKLAAASGVKRFVFVSSVKAGGLSLAGKCMTQSDQNTPDGIYGHTKREAELALLEIGKKTDMHVSIIRPALVYGPGVNGNLRKMLLAVKRGWFPPLPETGNRRSMIHVDDLVTSLLLMAEDKRASGEIFIATDGIEYSTRSIYDAMRFALGKGHMMLSIPRFFFSIAGWLGDRIGRKFPFNSDKMHKLLGDECYSSKKLSNLGYKPRHTLQGALPEIITSFESDI